LLVEYGNRVVVYDGRFSEETVDNLPVIGTYLNTALVESEGWLIGQEGEIGNPTTILEKVVAIAQWCGWVLSSEEQIDFVTQTDDFVSGRITVFWYSPMTNSTYLLTKSTGNREWNPLQSQKDLHDLIVTVGQHGLQERFIEEFIKRIPKGPTPNAQVFFYILRSPVAVIESIYKVACHDNS